MIFAANFPLTGTISLVVVAVVINSVVVVTLVLFFVVRSHVPVSRASLSELDSSSTAAGVFPILRWFPLPFSSTVQVSLSIMCTFRVRYRLFRYLRSNSFLMSRPLLGLRLMSLFCLRSQLRDSGSSFAFLFFSCSGVAGS